MRSELLRAALGADPLSGRTIDVDGVRLAYDDEGQGPVVLCLHSIAHGARDYAPLRERLRGRCRVIALDWPGHGRSSEDRAPSSAARYAEIAERFADVLGLRDVVLVGNSIGGAVAIRLAAKRPDVVRALVLADAGGLDRVDFMTRTVTRAMARFFAAGVRGARWYPRASCAASDRAAASPRTPAPGWSRRPRRRSTGTASTTSTRTASRRRPATPRGRSTSTSPTSARPSSRPTRRGSRPSGTQSAT